ncbi:MAG: transcription termination/antitermination protein NusA [Micavibrio sp.]|nr:transcription termination/antitermination protein NusA [Micavibrio sp.]|tara:strand:+ start:1313 stop:2857 length:1545 start_codon:yes stop_codon:yes gene_type:complete
MEILQVADNVAREKNIDKDVVIVAMEEAIQKAGRSKYGFDQDIRATIDRKKGTIALQRFREVVEELDPEAESAQITLATAKRIKPDAKIGDHLIDDLPPIDFGRIAAQTAKQVITQRVREAERERQFNEYKDRVGEVITGIVKRVEFGNATIDLGRAEAILRRDETLPRENLNTGERVRAIIYDVRSEQRGPQIFLSRTRPEFMEALFAQEVPEIYDGLIEVKAVARDPGSRAKILVRSKDGSVDPVGACVGMRGSRVQAIVNELGGEKIDIIPFSEDIVTIVVNSLQPAQVTKVVIDEGDGRIDVVVGEEQLSLAIGRRGQNVRLASILLGWKIDILTEEQEATRRAEEFKIRSELFINALDVDDTIAQLLVAEGFISIEDIAEIELYELTTIEGFDEAIAAELQTRAQTYLENKQKEFEALKKKLSLKDDLLEVEGVNADLAIKLAEAGIKDRDDLADLAGDELVELLGAETMTEKAANKLIMAARAHWFEEEDKKAEAAAAAEGDESEQVA